MGFAAEKYYRVLNGEDGALLWENPTKDASSKATGSSVFDFEGDGAAEVVYADEDNLWVYDGATGTVEMKWESHASGTLSEYPIIVDVDGDGSTEIVVASNNYAFAGSTGITVIGDATESWPLHGPFGTNTPILSRTFMMMARCPKVPSQLDGLQQFSGWK